MDQLILAIDLQPIIYPGDPLNVSWPMDLPPQKGAFDNLEKMLELFEVHVISTRTSHYSYLRWWKRFGWVCDKQGWPEGVVLKHHVDPATHLYLGARVKEWRGIWPSPLELTKFRPYAGEKEVC